MSPLGRLAITLTALLVLVWPASQAPVSAWGAQGHRVVARIAWALMNATSRDRAAALLDGRLEAFMGASTWADEIRSERPETYNWHFVNIPFAETHYDAARDCPATDRGDCVIAAIARARAELAAASLPQVRRGEALKFLVHFVGDVHQPLHTIDHHDRGGNDVRLAALRGDEGRATNLHAAWDTGLINLSAETEAARADRLLGVLKARPSEAQLNVVSWAEQGHDLAVRVVYRYPGFSPAGPPADPVVLDEAYRARAADTIDAQLALAGSRLAALLNAVLGGAGS